MADNQDIAAAVSAIVTAHLAATTEPILNEGYTLRLIERVREALTGRVDAPPAPPAVPLRPAVPIEQSVTPDFIICLEDGLQFQSMRRHIAKLGFTPSEYRARWGLAPDYPMVAKNYAERRSVIAKDMGLGKREGAAA